MAKLPVKTKLHHDQRVFILTLLAGLPATVVAMVLLWVGAYSAKVQWTVTLLVLGFWWGFAFAVRERVIRPLQTLSNMLAALREGDFSIRGRRRSTDDALGLALLEVSTLGETLREQRIGAVEATALLSRVMEEIDVVIFAFDLDNRLRLVNRAGQRLLAQPAERLLGRTADDLGLTPCLTARTPSTLELTYPGSLGRWEVRRTTFRQGGVRHQLLVLSDLSRALREEERQAWKRLIRVLGHEINNSLAPIKSMAGSLLHVVSRKRRASDWEDDLRQGLTVISTRSEALSRFMGAYAQLARLPQPRLQRVNVQTWVKRVVDLETRLDVAVRPGREGAIRADGDQLDQLLINLVTNGVDAALETGGGVEVGWRENAVNLEVWVQDDGPGLPDTKNLFVPFYTTKKGGSGIGLVLARQIAEAHGGTLTLANRPNQHGCVARLSIPLSQAN